jgi:hypothetical protein
MFEILRDSDPTVSGNCVCVLNEVLGLADRSSPLLNKPLVIFLLSRFSICLI